MDLVKTLTEAVSSGGGWTVPLIVAGALFAKLRDLTSFLEYFSERRIKKLREVLKAGGLSSHAERLLKEELSWQVVSKHTGLKGSRRFLEAALASVETGSISVAELARVRLYLKEVDGRLQPAVPPWQRAVAYASFLLAFILEVGAAELFWLAWKASQEGTLGVWFMVIGSFAVIVGAVNFRQGWLVVEATRVGAVLAGLGRTEKVHHSVSVSNRIDQAPEEDVGRAIVISQAGKARQLAGSAEGLQQVAAGSHVAPRRLRKAPAKPDAGT